MNRYAVHPEEICGAFISGQRLIELYKLSPVDTVIWDSKRPGTYMGKNIEDYIHLYPKINGEYNLNKHTLNDKSITIYISTNKLSDVFELARKHSQNLLKKGYWIIGVFIGDDVIQYEFEHIG